jgi:hypothetical protein
VDLVELVRAMMRGDALAARARLADARAADVSWSVVAQPAGLDAAELAVAAALVEVMASRAGEVAPAWTATIGEAPEVIFLVASARAMPRTRRLCETLGPEPFRRRRILALPNCYTFA